LLVYLGAGPLQTAATEGTVVAPPRPPDSPDLVPIPVAAQAPLLTARLERRASVEEGRRVRVAVDLDGLYFFDPQTGAAIA
jgi:hypothetical protein